MRITKDNQNNLLRLVPCHTVLMIKRTLVQLLLNHHSIVESHRHLPVNQGSVCWVHDLQQTQASWNVLTAQARNCTLAHGVVLKQMLLFFPVAAMYCLMPSLVVDHSSLL
jgi:hypothetical protein